MRRRGFTLIELSIVLVIIGLIVGGVLVGRDLIEAATIRATIGQIEKYNTAVNVFRNKYNALPGDLTNVQAAQFGMQARSGAAYHGDGDGRLTGCNAIPGAVTSVGCEDILFWRDLSQAGLISESLVTATDALAPNLPSSSIPRYFPAAKLTGNYFAVGTNTWPSYTGTWFGIDGIVGTDASSEYTLQPRMTAQQAYAIDAKIDDGLPWAPGSGTVLATQSLGVALTNSNSGPTECKITVGAADIYNTTYTTPTCGLLIRMSSWPQ